MKGISSYSSSNMFGMPAGYLGGMPGAGNRQGIRANNQQDDMFQSVSSRYADEASRQKEAQTRQMRDLLRGLQQSNAQKENPYAVDTQDRLADFLKLSGASQEDEDEEKDKPVRYNDKEVAAKIQRAKTSVSAGQAVLSAKRKVLEVKRKIASGNGDPEELQLALTHAKRMEIVAKKKKNHLELEEMVQVTQRRDEKADSMEDAASAMRSSLVSLAGEKITRKEDEIFDEREKMIHEAECGADDEEYAVQEPTGGTAAYENAGDMMSFENASDMLQGLNELIAEFGEDALRELEDISEELSGMEVVDPHMSREDLEDLKRKHRQSENKEMVKADMEYLKGMIRHQLEGANAFGAGNGGSVGIPQTLPSMPSVSGAAGMSGAGGSMVDVQV